MVEIFFHTSQDKQMIDSVTETGNVFVYLDSIVEVLTLVSRATVTYGAQCNTRDPCIVCLQLGAMLKCLISNLV